MPDVSSSTSAPKLRLAFQSRTLRVDDWRCRGGNTSPGREEAAQAHQVVLTRSGAYRRHSGSERVLADPGTVVFYEPERGYRVSHPVAEPDSCTVFQVTAQGTRDLLEFFDVSVRDEAVPRFPVSHLRIEPRALLLSHLILRAAYHDGDAVAVEETALALLHRVLARAYRREDAWDEGDRSSGPARECAARVREIVVTRFRERLTLDMIAAEVQASPFRVCRLFRTATGSTIHRHLLGVRLHHAADRIVESGEPLSRIAYECGFHSHSHLTEAFGRAFGMTPSAARRMSLAGHPPAGF